MWYMILFIIFYTLLSFLVYITLCYFFEYKASSFNFDTQIIAYVLSAVIVFVFAGFYFISTQVIVKANYSEHNKTLYLELVPGNIGDSLEVDNIELIVGNKIKIKK